MSRFFAVLLLLGACSPPVGSSTLEACKKVCAPALVDTVTSASCKCAGVLVPPDAGVVQVLPQSWLL